MNEEKFKKGIESVNKIQMSEDDKIKIFKNLSFYVDESSNKKISKSSPYFNIFEIFTHRSFVTIFVFILTFVGIGGMTVVAAEKSLPGDFLYPVKVNFNEPFINKTTLGQNAKIEWEAEKVDRRLQEAEVLAEKGLLNSKSREEIETRVLKHSEKFDEITEFENKKIIKEKEVSEKKILESENIKTNFEKNINKHTENLEKIEEKLSNGKKEEVKILRKNLIEKVKNRKEENKKNSR